MDYRKTHDAIIKRATERARPDCYCEKHHVIPLSMGGGNGKENIVWLTGREHYLVHWLLYKMYKNRQMAHAWFRMTHKKGGTGRYTSATFAYARVAKVLMSSGPMSPVFGKPLSCEHKAKLSAAKKGKTYAEIGRDSTALIGRKLSDEHRRKIALAGVGRKHGKAAIEKLRAARIGESNPNYGKRTPDEVRAKLSSALKGRELPHKRRPRQSNTSGTAGVRFDSSRNKWCVTISIGGKNRFIGRFDAKEQAIIARRNAEAKYLPKT